MMRWRLTPPRRRGTEEQNDESKKSLPRSSTNRYIDGRGRFRTIASRNDQSFSPPESGKKVLTSVKKRKEERVERESERKTDRLNCPNGDKRNFKGR